MTRVLSVMALVAGMVAFAGSQTAQADLVEMDSADFSYKYEMNADPATEDLSGTAAGVDWENVSGTPTIAGGEMTTPDGGWYLYSYNGLAGAVVDTLSYAGGYTIEMRAQTIQTGARGAFDIACVMAGAGKSATLVVSDTGLSWGLDGITNFDLMTGVDNSDVFHTFRVAQLPNSDSYSVWRDGVLVAEELVSQYTEGTSSIFIGAGSANDTGTSQVDYIRVTAGAYAPVAPVPEPTAFCMAITGLIGLLAYAWRKRK